MRKLLLLALGLSAGLQWMQPAYVMAADQCLSGDCPYALLGKGGCPVSACIEEVRKCHDDCSEAVTYCLRTDGQHGQADRVQSLLDCVELCQTAEDLLTRHSRLYHEVCGLTALACLEASAKCSELKDAKLDQCIASCRRTAEMLQKMDHPKGAGQVTGGGAAQVKAAGASTDASKTASSKSDAGSNHHK